MEVSPTQPSTAPPHPPQNLSLQSLAYAAAKPHAAVPAATPELDSPPGGARRLLCCSPPETEGAGAAVEELLLHTPEGEKDRRRSCYAGLEAVNLLAAETQLRSRRRSACPVHCPAAIFSVVPSPPKPRTKMPPICCFSVQSEDERETRRKVREREVRSLSLDTDDTAWLPLRRRRWLRLQSAGRTRETPEKGERAAGLGFGKDPLGRR